MVRISELAEELDLSPHELRAVCALAGVTISAATTFIDDGDALRVRDVLEGRAKVKAPRRKVSVSPRTRLILAAAAIAAVLVGAGAAWYQNQPARITVRAGNCFNEPPILGSALDPVSCNGPHKYRAFARIELDEHFGETYPGDDKVEAHMRDRCEALNTGQGAQAVTEFLLTVDIYYFYPHKSNWNRGVRAGICATRA